MSFRKVSRERLHETAHQFLKFGIVGGLGFIIDTSFLYFGIYVLHLTKIEAGFFSFPFAVTFSWIGNRMFTFKDAAPMRAHQQLVKFAAICAIGLIFNRGTYTLLIHQVAVVNDYPVLGLVAGTCAGMFFNFFATRKHVFGM